MKPIPIENFVHCHPVEYNQTLQSSKRAVHLISHMIKSEKIT